MDFEGKEWWDTHIANLSSFRADVIEFVALEIGLSNIAVLGYFLVKDVLGFRLPGFMSGISKSVFSKGIIHNDVLKYFYGVVPGFSECFKDKLSKEKTINYVYELDKRVEPLLSEFENVMKEGWWSTYTVNLSLLQLRVIEFVAEKVGLSNVDVFCYFLVKDVLGFHLPGFMSGISKCIFPDVAEFAEVAEKVGLSNVHVFCYFLVKDVLGFHLPGFMFGIFKFIFPKRIYNDIPELLYGVVPGFPECFKDKLSKEKTIRYLYEMDKSVKPLLSEFGDATKERLLNTFIFNLPSLEFKMIKFVAMKTGLSRRDVFGYFLGRDVVKEGDFFKGFNSEIPDFFCGFVPGFPECFWDKLSMEKLRKYVCQLGVNIEPVFSEYWERKDV